MKIFYEFREAAKEAGEAATDLLADQSGAVSRSRDDAEVLVDRTRGVLIGAPAELAESL